MEKILTIFEIFEKIWNIKLLKFYENYLDYLVAKVELWTLHICPFNIMSLTLPNI